MDTYAITRTDIYRDHENRPRLSAYGRKMDVEGETYGNELYLGTLTEDILETDSDGNTWAALGGDRCLLREGDAEHVMSLQ